MRRYSGRHVGRAPRLRVALVLALCASSLTAILAGPAGAVPSLSLGLLGDLTPGGNPSTVYGGVQASGENYFFTSEEGCVNSPCPRHLYVSDGTPGSAVIVDPPNGQMPYHLLSLGDGGALLAATAGPSLESKPRVFIANGSAGGTCALQEDGTCGIPAGASDAGLYPAENGTRWALTEDYGAVVLAASVTSAGPSQYAVGHTIPWLIERASTGPHTVEPLVLGFSYNGPGGAPLASVSTSMVGPILATIGDIVYADLIGGTEGDELYALDLTSSEPEWALLGGGMSEGSASTTFGRVLGVADDLLYFTASPSTAEGLWGLYVTDGDAIDEVAAPGELAPSGQTLLSSNQGPGSVPGVAVGPYLYFAAQTAPFRSLFRVSPSGWETVATCSTNSPTVSQSGAVGTTLYFPCSEKVDDTYETGTELYRIADADTSEPSAATLVFDLGLTGGAAIYPDDDGVGLRPTNYSDLSLTEYRGTLYLAGYAPTISGTASYQRAYRDLYTFDGETLALGPRANRSSGSSFIDWISAAGDRLFLGASNGYTGVEPWVAYVPQSTLSVVVSGEGQVTSDPFGISCVEPPTGEDVCTRDFDAGTEVTLAAYEDLESGYSFSGWSPNCAPTEPGAPFCTVTMSQARTVTAFFAASGDSLALAGSAPDAVGAGALVPFRLDVRNLTVGNDPLNVSIGVTTSLVLATAGCGASTDYDAECVVPPIPSGESRSLTVYAYAPSAGTAGAAFEIIAPPGGDDETNNVVSLSVPVESDVLSMLLTSYPVTATEGSPVTYGLRLTNGTASTTATGVALRAGFDRSVTFPPTDGCTVDTSGLSGYVTLVTCTLTDLAPAGSPRAIALGVVAPATGGVDLRAEFRVTYTQSGGTLTANDTAGPVVTAIEAPVPGELASTTQSFDAPTTANTNVTTLPSGGGLTAIDQSGAGVLLPGGFLGSVNVADVDETPLFTPANSLRLGVLAKQNPPGVVECAAAEYYADCLSFRVTIDQAFDVRFVYTLTFRFDESAFRDSAGALLRIRNVSFFHDTVGDPSAPNYVLVPACPRKATALTYTGSGPCLQSKRADRATGDYIFVILTDTNGNWKPGR